MRGIRLHSHLIKERLDPCGRRSSSTKTAVAQECAFENPRKKSLGNERSGACQALQDS